MAGVLIVIFAAPLGMDGLGLACGDHAGRIDDFTRFYGANRVKKEVKGEK